ncbi:Uncharacterised protein [Mycobacteroides abscessus subsp. abscessus]|nr:Uncharacterised protein [Mycobacteroides abscessus subsp. abscessus]
MAPAAKVTSNSSTEMSNDGETACATTASAVTPNAAPEPAARFASPRCGTTTAFGSPVEPEV